MDGLALHPAVLVLFGAGVGFLGTLVGVGGGFFMVPYLTLLGHFRHGFAVGTSLGAIVFNAVSGSIRWTLQKRIDWVIGGAFAVATLPGAWLGRVASRSFNASSFSIAFAALMAVTAASILLVRPAPGEASRLAWFRRGLRRDFTDSFGVRHQYSVNLPFGIAVSLGVGFLSALFGVGGGFLHVPVMVVLYGMPMHVAVATSQVVLAVTAGAGAVAYAIPLGEPMIGNEEGPHSEIHWPTMLLLGLGAAGGAQLGAFVAPKIAAEGLRRILAVLVFIVAVVMALDGAGWVNLRGGR